MDIEEITSAMFRLAHRGARIGLDAAQAGVDLARAVVDLLDPDLNSTSGHREDRLAGLLKSIEAVASLVGADRPLGQALRPGGMIDQLFSAGSALDQLAMKDGLKNLIREAIDIEGLDRSVEELSRVAEQLNAAAAPLGRVAARVPKFLRRPLSYEMEAQEQAQRSREKDQTTQLAPQLRDDGHGLVNTAWYEASQGNGYSIANGNGNGNKR